MRKQATLPVRLEADQKEGNERRNHTQPARPPFQGSLLSHIPDGLAPYQPEFRHLLVDLNHIDADDLQGTLIAKTSLLALKASHQGLHNELPRLFLLLAEMMQQDSSLSMIRTLLRYICIVDNNTDLTEYIKQVEATQQPQLQEEAMTIAEQLITKGRQQGMQQGRQEGRQEGMQQAEIKTLLKILNKRFGLVSQAIEKKISTATTSQLEAWIDASLDADNLQQIFNT